MRFPCRSHAPRTRRATPLGVALVALFAFSCAHAAAADPTPGQQRDAGLYLYSIQLPKQAMACAERIAGYDARFQPAFVRWKAQNAASIANGEAFMRAAATDANRPFEADIARVTQADADLLRRATPEGLAKTCDALLELVDAGR
jgi:hypothetical protein